MRDDYFKMLKEATKDSNSVIKASLEALSKEKIEIKEFSDASKCDVLVDDSKSVLLFNSLVWKRTVHLCFLTHNENLKIFDSNQKIVSFQHTEPLFHFNQAITVRHGVYKLIAIVEMEPLQFNTFYFKG